MLTLDSNPPQNKSKFLKFFPYGCGPKRLGNSPAMKQWLLNQAKNKDTVIFHNHSLWMMPNIYPGKIANKYHIPYIVSPRGTFTKYAIKSGSKIKKLFWPLLQQPSLKSVSCFHATCEAEYLDIRRMGFNQPVAIIPNGIDIPRLIDKKSNNFKTLLFLGRIHPNKGLDMLLPAWKAIQNNFPDWNLKIVGPDNNGYLLKMKKLSENLLLERVEFVGSLYGDDKWQAYAKADLFILPSYSENFGMSVAEALASGTPAIVSKGAPWNDLKKHNAGWWIELGVEPLVNCLNNVLLSDSEQFKIMGKNGRKWMNDEFSWINISKMMKKTYYWVLNGGNTPNWIKIN